MKNEASRSGGSDPDTTDLTLIRKILELETLFDVGAAISSVLNLDELTDEILTRLAILLDLKGAFLLLKSQHDGQLKTAATFGIEDKAILELQLTTEDDIFESVISAGKARVLNDINAPAAGCRHLMVIPLKARDEMIGVLGVMDRESKDDDVAPFTEEDEHLVSAFANQAGIAVSNVRLYANLQHSNERLTDTLSELQEAHEHIIQAERMRALGQMASGVVHDVNNAIASILGYTELWTLFPKMLDNKDKILHDLNTINTAAKDATHIIRRLRGFYRPREEGNKIFPINLNDVIPQSIDITRPRWHTQARDVGITIHMETDLNDIPSIPGDDADLREMFINLIFNAVDAMNENGSITFRTRHLDEEDQRYVILEVGDTGTGMPEEVRRQCLEPFFSTKGDKGTGMGLAMVFGIIQRHHGTLEIESELGVGTLFRMRFPVTEPPPSSDMQDEQHVLLQPVHVLVADDDPIQREIMKNFLISDGHKATVAEDGRQALEKFYKGQFDAVLTDRLMPDMDGHSLAQSIKEIAPRKPIVLVTGDEDLDGEPDKNVDAVLVKPVSLEEFRRTLAAVIVRPRVQ